MIERMSYVVCDGAGCGAPAPMGDNVQEARAMARFEKFVTRGKDQPRDLCPTCRPDCPVHCGQLCGFYPHLRIWMCKVCGAERFIAEKQMKP